MSRDRTQADWREQFRAHGLDESDVAADPLTQFDTWFEEAVGAGVYQPDAMVLATAGADGAPTSRHVLLRAVDEGFVFYTNYESRKGEELVANPRASITVGWVPIGRQVLVVGTVEETTEEESDEYFASRPRPSQLAAWASDQSRPLRGRAELDERFAAASAEWEGTSVERPPYWGGFRLLPDEVEFWQGRADRLHDRLRYERDGDAWTVHRYAP